MKHLLKCSDGPCVTRGNIVKYDIRLHNRTIHRKIGKFTLKSEALAGLHLDLSEVVTCGPKINTVNGLKRNYMP